MRAKTSCGRRKNIAFYMRLRGGLFLTTGFHAPDVATLFSGTLRPLLQLVFNYMTGWRIHIRWESILWCRPRLSAI